MRFSPQRYNAPSTWASTTQTPLAALDPPASTTPERPETRRTRPGERLRSPATAAEQSRRPTGRPDHRREQQERKEARERSCRDKTRRNQLPGGSRGREGGKERRRRREGWKGRGGEKEKLRRKSGRRAKRRRIRTKENEKTDEGKTSRFRMREDQEKTKLTDYRTTQKCPQETRTGRRWAVTRPL